MSLSVLIKYGNTKQELFKLGKDWGVIHLPAQFPVMSPVFYYCVPAITGLFFHCVGLQSTVGESQAVILTAPTIVYPQKAVIVQQEGRYLEHAR